ncbi:MAG TPA: hypothetical protein VLA16_15090 [Ideonella sp.]|nr:hypothetical protein [Ideonella sp.]
MASGARRVFVHYHLFKNAGTSLDRWLRVQFGDGWHAHEGDRSLWPADHVMSYLRLNPEVKLLSSHTALLAPSGWVAAADLEIMPIVFLRHPIDRARSVYEFELHQQADTEGASQAKALSIRAYFEWRLSRSGDRTVRNFQSHRLRFAGMAGADELALALDALQRLPFVGLVESFEASLQRLARLLPAQAFVPPPPARLNRTQVAGSDLPQRLAELRSALGDALFARLVEANRSDLLLHTQLRQSLAESARPGRDTPQGD